MPGQFMRGEPRPVIVPFALAKACAVGDLIATLAADGSGYKASEQTWNTDLATTRADFCERFVGASNQAKDANVALRGGAGYPLGLEVFAGGVRAYASPNAGTYYLGTLVGPAKDTGNALLDQTLEIVTDARQAIGIVVGGAGVNPSAIEVELFSTLAAVARHRNYTRNPMGAPTAKTVTATLTAAEVISGVITASQGGAAAATYTLPTGAQLSAVLPANFAVNDTFDLSLINISTNAAEVATLAAGANFTIVGNASVAANVNQNSASALFRIRKTATDTYVAYRIA